MTDPSTTDRSDWASLMDQVTKEHQGEDVAIDILDRTYGDSPEVDRLPFEYAAYDDKDDVAFVVVGGNSPRLPVALRHMVEHPSELTVTQDPPALRLVDRDGTATIVSFFRTGS